MTSVETARSTSASQTMGRCIIILGMHRSGTSALTGSLEEAGVVLGEVGIEAPDNAKGNREPPSLTVLHDDLLNVNGGSWRHPVAPLTWEPIHRLCRDLFIRQFEGVELWGFKDPRTMLALGGWRPALPEAELVGIFRHPFLVADSLHRRDGIRHADGLALWTYYNRVLLWWVDREPDFRLIEFDRDQAVFRKSLARMVADLRLPASSTGFFDPSLRSERLPELDGTVGAGGARRLYDQLQERVGGR